jgi:transposase
VGCNESSLYRWFWLYQQRGLEGLLEHPVPSGRPTELTPSIRQALEQKLSEPNGWRSYGELKAWLQREFGSSSSYSSVYRWVRYKLQSKPKVPQRRAQQASEQQQRQFKKTPTPAERHAPTLRGKSTAALLLHGRVPLGAQNRARASHHAQRGQAGAPVQWTRANCWLYGAVEVPSGQSVFYIFSHLDAVCFQRFLDYL